MSLIVLKFCFFSLNILIHLENLFLQEESLEGASISDWVNLHSVLK